jgi:prophage maintenance system killer protein
MIQRLGGLPGIRSESLLISALDAPKASFSRDDLYPTVHEKGAVLLYHLIA